MIHQYFTDLSSSHDNYVEIISFCKHLINPTVVPTITRLVGVNGNNGKSCLIYVIKQLTTANYMRIHEGNLSKEFIDTLDLSKPTILFAEETDDYGFFERNGEFLKNLPRNVHVVYVENINEQLLATTNTHVKTIYMTQYVNNVNILGNLNMQDMAQFINTH